MNNNRLATEKQKLIQEKCLAILTTMLKDEDNKYCVDCDAKGPRWASWNLGVFLCIRCAGIHRNLGVHISKVKSVNLDTWKPEQAVALQQMGNSRARAVYEANLPDNFRRPQTDASLESFIRAKYEHNKYTAREWVPPKPPRVNWDAEIDAMQREHRKGSSRGRVEQPATPVLKKPLPTPAATATPPPPPPPTKDSPQQKPPPAAAPAPAPAPAASTDLLGLETPSPTPAGGGAATDVFGDFLSAAPAAEPAPAASGTDSLAADEANFFSQPAEASGGGAKVMSKDSILALFGQSRPGAGPPQPGGGLAGLNMPTAALPGYTAQPQMPAAYPQQQVPGGFPQQQQVPAGFPQQQPPAGFPQQQQVPGGFPQQMPMSFQPMPSAFPQQQQPQSMPAAFGGQTSMPGYPQGGFSSQQAAPGVSQQSFSMAYPAPQQATPQFQPAPYQQPLHQQMSGLALGEQQARLVAGGTAFPPMGGAQPLNGQLWQ